MEHKLKNEAYGVLFLTDKYLGVYTSVFYKPSIIEIFKSVFIILKIVLTNFSGSDWDFHGCFDGKGGSLLKSQD